MQKKRGRPRLIDDHQLLQCWITARQKAAIRRFAKAQRTTISAIMRVYIDEITNQTAADIETSEGTR